MSLDFKVKEFGSLVSCPDAVTQVEAVSGMERAFSPSKRSLIGVAESGTNLWLWPDPAKPSSGRRWGCEPVDL